MVRSIPTLTQLVQARPQTKRIAGPAGAAFHRGGAESIDKAATLLEALPYIQRFRSQTFVVKYGGSFVDSPDAEMRSGAARDVVSLEAVGVNLEVVR